MTTNHCTILPVDRCLQKPLSARNNNIVKALVLTGPASIKYVKVELYFRGGYTILILKNIRFDEERSPDDGHCEVVGLEVPPPVFEFLIMVNLNRFFSLNKQQADILRII